MITKEILKKEFKLSIENKKIMILVYDESSYKIIGYKIYKENMPSSFFLSFTEDTPNNFLNMF
jgi:hypothetical protein